MFMQSSHIVEAEIPSGNTRLVRHYNDKIAGLFELFYRLWNAGNKFKILDFVQIMFVNVYGSIPIQEYSRFLLGSLHVTSPGKIRVSC